MSRALSTLSLTALALLGGCPKETSCTTEARSSVSLTLLDEDGDPVAGADVTFAVDGGPEQDCEDFGAGAYVCGWEVEGTLELTVRALGFEVDTFAVDVEADECHVITEVVAHTLTAADCTAEVVTGVLVRITDGQGQDVTDATVTWSLPNAELAPQDCDPLGGNEWSCAEDHPGLVEISITDAGPYEPFSAEVDVPHDGCHPITQTLDAVLQYLPD